MEKPQTIEAYILQQPVSHREKLLEIWEFIAAQLPQATEEISYGMPIYKYHGMLVGFAYIKTGVSFYACNTKILVHLKAEFEGYHINVSALHIRLDQPLPKTGIEKVIAYRKKENLEKVQAKKRKK